LLSIILPDASIPINEPSPTNPPVTEFVYYVLTTEADARFKCKRFVGTPVPIPTLPPLSILILSVLVVKNIISVVS
jgi:hypothetical protein